MYSKRQRTLKNKKEKKTSMYFVDKEEQPFKNVIRILHSKLFGKKSLHLF